MTVTRFDKRQERKQTETWEEKKETVRHKVESEERTREKKRETRRKEMRDRRCCLVVYSKALHKIQAAIAHRQDFPFASMYGLHTPSLIFYPAFPIHKESKKGIESK